MPGEHQKASVGGADKVRQKPTFKRARVSPLAADISLQSMCFVPDKGAGFVRNQEVNYVLCQQQLLALPPNARNGLLTLGNDGKAREHDSRRA